MSVEIITLDKYSKVNSLNLLEGLEGYWKLDETSGDATDSSGNSRTGTSGDIVYTSSGKISRCFGFTNSSSIVIVVNDVRPTTAMSISFWFKNTSNGSEQCFVSHTGYDSAWKGYRVTIYDSGSIGLFLADGNSSHLLDVAYSSSKNDGNWHHVLVTFNGSYVYIYLDGVKNSGWSWPYTLAYISGTNYLYFGNNAGSIKLNGVLDEIGIWDRALTDTEAEELYNSGSGLTYPFS